MRKENKNAVKNIFFGIFASAALYSCTAMATSQSKVGSSQENIMNTKWTLADNVKGKTPTLNIETSKITGNGGCNSYFGEVTLDASSGSFSANRIGSTKMACDQIATETSFLNMLDEATKYVVSGNTLELYKGNLLLLKFNKL